MQIRQRAYGRYAAAYKSVSRHTGEMIEWTCSVSGAYTHSGTNENEYVQNLRRFAVGDSPPAALPLSISSLPTLA